MSFKIIKTVFLVLVLSLISSGPVLAKLSTYTYPYDISEIEWKVLNWTAAWKGTTNPGDPFILDRIEYDRKTKKIVVYLTGKNKDDTEDNLKKSADKTGKTIKGLLAEFDMNTDLIINYTISSSDDPNKTYEISYENGAFDKAGSGLVGSDSTGY